MSGANKKDGCSVKRSGQARASGSCPAFKLGDRAGCHMDYGEPFATHQVTGAGRMNVHSHASPGCSGFGSQLSIPYDSPSGHGPPVSAGISPFLLAIARETDKDFLRYDDHANQTRDKFWRFISREISFIAYPENWGTHAAEATNTPRNPLPCDACTFDLTGYPHCGLAGHLQPCQCKVAPRIVKHEGRTLSTPLRES